MLFTLWQVLLSGVLAGIVVGIRVAIYIKQHENDEWNAGYIAGVWDQRNGEADDIQNIDDIK